MSKRGAGVAFIAISAFLLSSKYITAAIYSSGLNAWSGDVFVGMLNDVGFTFNLFATLSLITGITYLILAEKEVHIR